ncbi:MAG: ATP-binding protein [Formivibrio sp.]|nr:ATP-binding protein [Formivibrio sp.]
MNSLKSRRILVVDDTPTAHEDFRQILMPHAAEHSSIDDVKQAQWRNAPKISLPDFELDSAYQGKEGLIMVQSALAAGRPYAVVFIDIHISPDWDGMETIERLWQADKRLQIVICTAFSDFTWDEILARLDVRDRLLVLKKPFAPIEVYSLAHTLTTKWAQQQAEINERKRLQELQVQSEQFALIGGQLAANLAHEISNPIGYIFSNISTLGNYQDQLFNMLTTYEYAENNVNPPDFAALLQDLRKKMELDFLKQDIPALVNESIQGIDRVRQIVHGLKGFAQMGGVQKWESTNLHTIIDSALNMAAREIKYMTEGIKKYGQCPEIECQPSQIKLLVINLVVNAAQAIGEKRGRITISTGTQDDSVWLEVADTGSGITSDTLPRIFEPFFTTKPFNTGLGLSLSYSIVQKHRGHIEVESVVDQGTTFRVTLPMQRSVLMAGELSASA